MFYEFSNDAVQREKKKRRKNWAGSKNTSVTSVNSGFYADDSLISPDVTHSTQIILMGTAAPHEPGTKLLDVSVWTARVKVLPSFVLIG